MISNCAVKFFYLTKDGEITHNPNAFFSMHSMSMKIAENRSCAF